MKHKWVIVAPACHTAFGYKEPVMRFVLGEATDADLETLRRVGSEPVRNYISHALIINAGLGLSLTPDGVVWRWNPVLQWNEKRIMLLPLIQRIQRWWRRRRLLHAAAEYLAHPSSNYQQLVNCGRPAAEGWYGIRVRIEIPGQPVKEWKQLDSLRASGYSLAQIFGKPPAASGSSSTKRTKTLRKQTRPRRRLVANNEP